MSKIGSVVGGRYRIDAYVGAGGMQEVYRATDQKLEHTVALKTPLPGQILKRFAQSARVAARVNHYNVAKTLDYFVEDDSAYIIEEFVDGETLEAVFNKLDFVDPHMGARLLHHLAKGVAASHHAGVIHRDIKPSNVIATGGLGFDELKITDFGIATLTEEVFEEAAENGDLTQSTSGTIRGALPYMAPEMMFRKPGEFPGKEMDVWSVGALMFRLLTGKYPFGVNFEAAVNVRNENREPWPAFMTANKQFAPISHELQRIVDDCLKYDPTDRLTADKLTEECSLLCYLSDGREEGAVSNMIQNGYSGFAQSIKGKVFFSIHSVYGTKSPSYGRNNKVCFCSFPGHPRRRAHPIMAMK